MEKENAIELINRILSFFKDQDGCELDDEYISLFLKVSKKLFLKTQNASNEEISKIFSDFAENLGFQSLQIIVLVLFRDLFKNQEKLIAAYEERFRKIQKLAEINNETH